MTPSEMKVYARLRGRGLTHEGSSALAAALAALALRRQPATGSDVDSLAAQARPLLTPGDIHLLAVHLRAPAPAARGLIDEMAEDIKAESADLRDKFREWDERQNQLMAILTSVIKTAGRLRQVGSGAGL